MPRFDISTKAGVDAFIDEYRDTVNSLSVERYLNNCHDDIVWYDTTLPEPARGKQAVARLVVQPAIDEFDVFELSDLDPPHRTFDGDQVAWAWVLRGKANGTAVEMHGVNLYTIRDGLVAEVRGYNYFPEWLRQGDHPDGALLGAHLQAHLADGAPQEEQPQVT